VLVEGGLVLENSGVVDAASDNNLYRKIDYSSQKAEASPLIFFPEYVPSEFDSPDLAIEWFFDSGEAISGLPGKSDGGGTRNIVFI